MINKKLIANIILITLILLGTTQKAQPVGATETGRETLGAFECGPSDVDTDGDGVLDSIDLDNDNDGILDINEGESFLEKPLASLFPNPDFESVLGIPNRNTRMDLVVGWDQATAGTSDFYHEFGFMDLGGSLAPPTPSGFGFVGAIDGTRQTGLYGPYVEYIGNHLNSPLVPGVTYDFSLLLGALQNPLKDFSYDGQLVIYGHPNKPTFPVSTDSWPLNNRFGWEEIYRADVTVPEFTWEETRVTFTVDKRYNSLIFGGENAVRSGRTLLFDRLALNVAVTEDADGDGVPNLCDLDSDNDGISDLVESGSDRANADSNRDGTVSVAEAASANGGTSDADFDGLMDIFDANTANSDAAPSQGTDPLNSDGGDDPDFLDLDSDNDRIPDAIEGQLTLNYSTSFPTDNDVRNDDGDGDGVIEIYDGNGTFGGAFNIPQNTDGADAPDYLDTDSDNDTKLDSDERGDPASPSYRDPNGRMDDPQTALPNETGDTSEVAYRELAVPEPPEPPKPETFECGPTDIDTDGDGLPDSIDIDNDNDGITDRTEGFGTLPADVIYLLDNSGSIDATEYRLMQRIVNQTVSAVGARATGSRFALLHLSSPYEIQSDFTATPPAVSGKIGSSNGFGLFLDQISGELNDGDGRLDKRPDIPLKIIWFTDALEAEVLAHLNQTNAFKVANPEVDLIIAQLSTTKPTDWAAASSLASVGGFYDGAVKANAADPEGSEVKPRYFVGGNFSDTGSIAAELTDNILDSISNTDNDEDGVPNACDLDSDNDGISDLVESGSDRAGADSNNDGTVSVTEAAIANGGTSDADFDGLMDIFDANTADVDPEPSQGTDPVNSDGGDDLDFLDLDSDNDGIPDAIEAQETADYAILFPTDNDVRDDDADGDGVIEIYDGNGVFGGAFNTPQNTDGADEPDYLDTDSDNDTKLDSEEHGLGPENGGPANPTYPDPNGRIDDPQTTLLNESGDGTEVAYRELWVPPTIDPDDKDGDGVPNSVDIDDDNDGILDITENIDLDGDLGVRAFSPSGSLKGAGMGSFAHLQPAATNTCRAGEVAVALYGGSLSQGMVGANSLDSINNGICVQVVAAGDWASMSVEEFQTFDVLWIGNDDCGAVGGAAAFNQAVASRPVWETAIDPGNVMIAGGDYDYHVFRNGGGQARAVTAAMVIESADGSAPGLVLQAGCYSISGEPWLQNLGGTFEGLFHGGASSANPGPTDVTSHEFNTKHGWNAGSYAFGQSCHGGMYIVPGSPVEQYNLQVLFYYPGGVIPCFMMSDERFPPFFPTRDTDNDEIPDACDLDSDNDGISDLIESGISADLIAYDINKDGMVSPLEITILTGAEPDADGDGLMDIFDADITDPSSLTSIGTDPVNSDSDLRHDYIDLDSDGDRIPDAIEGKPTKGFGDLFGNDGDVRDDDIDTDGAISVFDDNDLGEGNFGGTFPLPEDTDKDGTPDYLDLDSDDDFALDEWESGLGTPTGIDDGNFADGIDDVINPSEFYRDNNGIVDLPWRDLADEDNNAETDGDVDFREFNPEFDRGDAPAEYGEATNSISDFVQLWMGFSDQRVDEDEDPFVAGVDALADDLTNSGSPDDEEGVTWYSEPSTYDTGIVFYPASPPGFGSRDGRYTFDVEVYNDTFEFGFLDVWIDFDGNRQFDPYELVQSQVVPRSTASQTLSDLEFFVPENAACGRSFARFRFSNEALNSPTGYGGWGEVEDHAITIDCRTDLEAVMEFEPNDPDINGIELDGDRTYRGDWELSHNIAVRAYVKNNGPQAARGMTVEIQLPTDMDDVAYGATGRWACTVDGALLATCTSFGMAVGDSEQVIDFTGRIPGTFPDNSVVGYTVVEHEGGDQLESNNRVDYDINVTKIWGGVEDVTPYIHARFSDALTISDPRDIDRDIESGERLVTPIQVPVYYAGGVEKNGNPILRTRWCEDNPAYPGCDEASDFILGTIGIKSHTTISITQMMRQPWGTFVKDPMSRLKVDLPITTMAARDNDGNPITRYVEDEFAECDLWMSRENGGCLAKQETIDGSTMTEEEKAFYEWDLIHLTPMVFQTSGGRGIECDNGEGECVYIENASPGIYLIEGDLTYQVIFFDPGGLRLGTEIYREDRTLPLSFFSQVIAPFVEPER